MYLREIQHSRRSYLTAAAALFSTLCLYLLLTCSQANATVFQDQLELKQSTLSYQDYCGESVLTEDLNNDGLGDLVTGCVGDNFFGVGAGAVTVYLADSGGGFTTGIDLGISTVNSECGRDLSAGDFDGDDDLDLFVGCAGSIGGNEGSVVLYRNNGSGSFTYLAELFQAAPAADDQCAHGPNSIVADDLNNDGFSELVVGCRRDDTAATNGGSVIVFQTDGGGVFDTGTELTQTVSPGADDLCGQSVATGDLNADGNNDIVMGCPSDNTFGSLAGSVLTFISDGAGGFSLGTELTQTSDSGSRSCGHTIQLLDLNDDQAIDILTACSDSGGSIPLIKFLGDSTGSFTTEQEVADTGLSGADRCGYSSTSSDINADGLTDVVIGCYLSDEIENNSGSAVVLTANPGGGFTPTTLTQSSSDPSDQCGYDVTAGGVGIGKGVAFGCPRDDTDTDDSGSVIISNVDQIPTVTITSPSSASTVSGLKQITVAADDDVAVQSVRILANGAEIASISDAPYSTTWDTTALPDGSYSLTAEIVDSQNQTATSTAVTVQVLNTGSITTPPTPDPPGTPEPKIAKSEIDSLKKSYKKGKLKFLTGTASGNDITGVRIALLRTGKGSSTSNTVEATAKREARSCLWMTKTGGFKRTKAKKSGKKYYCQPTASRFTLKPKLTKQTDGNYRWRYSFSKKQLKALTKGSYTVYSQAVDSQSGAETSLKTSSGNIKKTKVK